MIVDGDVVDRDHGRDPKAQQGQAVGRAVQDVDSLAAGAQGHQDVGAEDTGACCAWDPDRDLRIAGEGGEKAAKVA